MKKYLILVLCCILCCTMVGAKSYTVNKRLVGCWELCLADGKVSDAPNVRQKIYTKDSYVVMEVNKRDNITYIDFIGKLKADGKNKMTETPIRTNPMIKHMLFKDFGFYYKIKGDRLYLNSIDNSFSEIWIRVSK